MSNRESKSSTKYAISFYTILWAVLFWVITSNYSQDEADKDGLKYYYNYAIIKKWASIVLFVCIVIFVCTGAWALSKNNEFCTIISGFGFGIVFIIYIIIDLVYMYILISHNKEITKFKFITDGNTYSVMLQIVCMICMLSDFIFTCLLGCFTFGLPFFIKDILKVCGCKCCGVDTENDKEVNLPDGNTRMVTDDLPIVISSPPESTHN